MDFNHIVRIGGGALREVVVVQGRKFNVLVEKDVGRIWTAVGECNGKYISAQGSSPTIAIKRWREAVSNLER